MLLSFVVDLNSDSATVRFLELDTCIDLDLLISRSFQLFIVLQSLVHESLSLSLSLSLESCLLGNTQQEAMCCKPR